MRAPLADEVRLGNPVVALDELASQLAVTVLALISDLAMPSSGGFSLAVPVARRLLGAGQSLLCGGQLVRGDASPARIIEPSRV
jgi:hypothetical protein